MEKATIFRSQSAVYKLLPAIFLSVCIIFSICVYHSFADVPCMINYQGRLIEDNVPVNEPVNMEFKLYIQQTGGEPIKTITINNVPVHNGLFRVVLDLEGVNWAAGETIYLEVKAGTDTLTPREPIYAYPYAINSHLLEGKTTAHFLDISGSTQTKKGGLNIEGNVGIGTTNPGAKLEVSSTTSGFLPPRMTTAQRDAISNPPTGSVIYNIDSGPEQGLNYYNGTNWNPLGDRVKTWDSDWFYVTRSTKYYEINHSLGREPLIVQLWFSRQSDGSGEKILGSSIYSASGFGLKIYDYDSTKITVTTGGADYIAKFRDKNGTYIYPTTGYARIVALTD